MSFSKEDNSALLSSEVFRNFASSELMKEKAAIKTAEQLSQEKEAAIDAFNEFQKKVNASAKLKKTFKKLQEQFLTNAELAEQTDPAFLEGVLLLDIEE